MKELIEAARRCLSEPDGAPIALERLPGGGNNRIYQFATDSGRYVLKHYFQHPGDTRDRLDAEFRFCAFAWSHGIRCVPRPIGRGEAPPVGVYAFVPGRKLEPGEIGLPEIQQALAFFLELNRHRASPEARALPLASEACFSVEDHIRILDARIEKLSGMSREEAIDREALRFLEEELRPAWRELRRDLQSRPSEARLPLEGRVLSPSDFGFHNALRQEDGTLAFLDFEYAGWDDPAKLVGDFFSQVALPVPPSLFEGFAREVAASLPDPSGTVARMLELRPLYRLKWCCIALNHFLPVDRTRKAFAQGEGEPAAKAGQLAKARALLHTRLEATP